MKSAVEVLDSRRIMGIRAEPVRSRFPVNLCQKGEGPSCDCCDCKGYKDD